MAEGTPGANPVTDAGTTPSPADIGTALCGLWKEPLSWLVLALPVAVVLELLHAAELWIFMVSALAIVPLAGLMGRATENLAETLGAGIGGLLNATFGNAAELIIGLMALWKRPAMYPLVKASITGSIIGNILLVLGMAILVGGLYYPRQVFNRTAAGMGATLLALASIGLIVPTLYYRLQHTAAGLSAEALHNIESLSEEIAAILAVIYLLSLVFSLRTHRHLFAGAEEELPATGEHRQPEWNRRTSLIVLLFTTAGVAWMSGLLVGSVEHAGQALGLSHVFIGVFVVAIIGNAAEHSTAVLMAIKNKMDLTVHIAVGSGIQIALFVAPVLVFTSMLLGHPQSLDLHFTPLEIMAVIFAVGVLALVAQDGESDWMQGVMLLGVYVILALAFYHLPGGGL
jgi:Ca2+:H+ antiporter